MTNTAKSPARRSRGPRTVATAEQVAAAKKPPEAFIIPTPVLAEVVRLIGSIPSGQRAQNGTLSAGRVFAALEELKPLNVKPEVKEPEKGE